MPDGPDIAHGGSSGEESSWLSQYYTTRKTGGDLDADKPESGPAPSDLLATTPGGKYDVTGQVGVGGMKTVHRAHDRNADRDVALAMLRTDAPRSAQERRFLREARITAALEHPNIVPVHELGLDASNRPYFTMKLLGGENLHDILNHLDLDDPAYLKQYPLGRLLEIFRNVCNAAAFAHSRGVVHLDLKPANIQVGSFGEVLVLDWGLAKILDREGETLTSPPVHLPEILREVPVEGAVRGTPGYMAPEQERGNFAALDQRTDIYALGAVLQSMLHGKRSMRANKALRKAPAALDAVVAKAMAAEPRDRYQSVEELARDVRAFVGGFAVSAQTVGLGTLFWLFVKRHKAVSVVIVTSLVTITVLLTVFIIKITQSERRAVDTLAQLREEQAEKFRLGRFATPQLLIHADGLLRNVNYDDALSELNLILTLDKSMTEAWVRKGYLHLGREEFDDAMRSFDRVPNLALRAKRDKTLRPAELAEKYRPLVRATGSLSYTQLHQLIDDITNKANGISPEFQELALGQLFQRVNQSGPLDVDHLEFVGTMLCQFNPSVTNAVYQYVTDENGLNLDFHGDRMTQLMPLNGLPIYSLDLSGTAVVDLRWLHNSGLEVLGISGTPVKDLTPIFNLPITELRMVNCLNIRPEQLRNFPKLEKVVVSKKQSAVVEKLLSMGRVPPEVGAE